MVFEIFSYWNMRELELVFNAVASIVGSGNYLGLMRTLAIVGLLSMAMAVLAGFSQLPDFGRWIIMLAVFNGMLLVPKVNVVLTDRTGTEAPRTVANVPIGLAAFAHSVSHIGDWLTTTFETTFSLPGDIQFRTNGTLFGHRVQQEIMHTKFDNSILNSNILEFYRECITPEFDTGFIVASEMAKSNDIWTYLSGKTNPGRLVTIRAVPGSTPAADTYGCDVAYTHLGTQITYVNTQQMNALGKRLYPGLPTAAANAAVQSSIQTSTNYMLGISMSAMDITKQTAMSNFMIDAQYMLPAQIGDTAGAAANLAQAQAIRSTSESYKLMAKVGESTMPKIKNIIEVVQYSIFPIIMLLILMAGHKGGLVLKAYVMSLVWVQLWPPLYAIMHMIMTIHSQELAAMTSGMGLSMAEYNQVNNAYISDEAIAGMIAATAIPMIASAIVKGGDVGASALGGAISSPSQQATQAATAASQGNFSMGNASLGNQSASNLSMGKVNARSELTDGGMSITGSDNVNTFHGKNGAVINNSAAMQNTGVNSRFGQMKSAALTSLSKQSEAASLAESTASGSSITAARDVFSGFDKANGKGAKTGTTDTKSTDAQYVKSYGQEKSIADEVLKGQKLTEGQGAKIEAYARAQATGGLSVLGTGATTAVGGGVSTSSSSLTAQEKALATKLATNSNYKNQVAKTEGFSHKEDFGKSEDTSAKAAQGIKAFLQNSKTHVENSTAEHRKSDEFSTAAQKETGLSGSMDSNYNNRRMDWLTGSDGGAGVKNNATGKAYTVSEVEKSDREGRSGVINQKFVDEVLAKDVASGIEQPKNTVGATSATNLQQVGTEADVTQQAAKDKERVEKEQSLNGLNPNKQLQNNIAPSVQRALEGAGQQINLGNSKIDEKGNPLRADVQNATDPSNQHNFARAAGNFVAANTNDGTSFLLKEAGRGLGVDLSGASVLDATDKKWADSGGTVMGAVIETGVTAAGAGLGVVGGKVAGKVADKIFDISGKSGDAAQATAAKVLEKTEERLTAKGLTKEGKPLEAPKADVPEAPKAETPAAKPEVVSTTKAGAKAEVGATSTVDGAGKLGGSIAGGVGGSIVGGEASKQLTGENGVFNQPSVQPAIDAVKKTDAAVLDIVSDAANGDTTRKNK